MLSLLGSPKAYNNKKLGFIAYLAVHRGVLALFPAEENFRVRDDMSSVELVDEHKNLQDLCNKWCYEYVVVRGKFNSGDSSKTSGGRLGVLTDVEITPTYIQAIDKKDREVMLRIDLDAEADTKRKK